MWKRALRMWQAISMVDTVVGVAAWPIWKLAGAIVGGIAATIVSWIASVSIVVWFLLVVSGIAGGLFIANEFASRRLYRRSQRDSPVAGARGNGNPPISTKEFTDYLDRVLRMEINQVFFRGLWKDDISAGPQPNAEPFVSFQLVVWNNTPLSLSILGCDGRASIDGIHVPYHHGWNSRNGIVLNLGHI